MSYALNQLKASKVAGWGFTFHGGNTAIRTAPDGTIERWSSPNPDVINFHKGDDYLTPVAPPFKIDWSLHITSKEAAYASLDGLDGESRRLIVAYFHELEQKAATAKGQA